MPRDANGLTPKQALFVAEYRKDLNASAAAVRAGYTAKASNVAGAGLLSNPNIAKVLAKKTQITMEKLEITAERALVEAASLAFSDLSAFYDEAGEIRPMKAWTPGMRAAVQSMETLERDITPGERGAAAKVHRLKLWDKPKNLEMLFKHLGLLIERVHVTGNINEDLVKRARERSRS